MISLILKFLLSQHLFFSILYVTAATDEIKLKNYHNADERPTERAAGALVSVNLTRCHRPLHAKRHVQERKAEYAYVEGRAQKQRAVTAHRIVARVVLIKKKAI